MNKYFLIAILFLFGLIIAKLIYVAVSIKVDGIDIKTFALSRPKISLLSSGIFL